MRGDSASGLSVLPALPRFPLRLRATCRLWWSGPGRPRGRDPGCAPGVGPVYDEVGGVRVLRVGARRDKAGQVVEELEWGQAEGGAAVPGRARQLVEEAGVGELRGRFGAA